MSYHIPEVKVFDQYLLYAFPSFQIHHWKRTEKTKVKKENNTEYNYTQSSQSYN